MDDTSGVSGGERFGYRILPRLFERRALACNDTVERCSIHFLHYDEVHAIEDIDVVNGDDVGMIQRRRRLGLLHETPLALWVGNPFRRKNLDIDEPVEVSIAGFPDDTHTAFAELRFNALMAEGLTDHWRITYLGRNYAQGNRHLIAIRTPPPAPHNKGEISRESGQIATQGSLGAS